MRSLKLVILLLALAGLACNTVLPARSTVAPRMTPTRVSPTNPTRTPRPVDIVTETPRSVVDLPNGVRACGYIPGVSEPATMPPEILATPTPYPPFPTPTPPPVTNVDDSTMRNQLDTFEQLRDIVNDEYVYEDYNGHDWQAITDKYEGYIRAGLSDDDFYVMMNLMIAELGDEHSRYDSPEQVKEDDAQFSGNNDYVGIGVIHSGVPDKGYSVIILTFPDSPAREAGLKAHDIILSADGESVIDENGILKSNIRGPEGTELVLRVQTPGEEPRDLTITRRRITGAVPIDYCLIPEPRIGYLFIPSFADSTIPDQIYTALEAMNADGQLQGLILDNRQNLGGSISAMETTLGYFTDGHQGDFVTRNDSEPVQISAEDVAGSQTVPLVVLVDLDSASAGEIFSGILQNSGRAQIVGQVTPGNVEELYGYDFSDGSRAWIASATFKPLGLPAGTWEKTGIVPDVLAPTRWDLFNEATDPALAAAVELLTK